MGRIEDTVLSLKSRIALFREQHSWVWDATGQDTLQAKRDTGRDAPEGAAVERTGDAQTFRQDSMGG